MSGAQRACADIIRLLEQELEYEEGRPRNQRLIRMCIGVVRRYAERADR